jgi:hypothetical protein
MGESNKQKKKEKKREEKKKFQNSPSKVMSAGGSAGSSQVRPGGRFTQHVVVANACTSLIASRLLWERRLIAALVLDGGACDGGHQQRRGTYIRGFSVD